jgi:HTH-type transcriptional regulator/antitoxin HipB
MTTKFSRPGQNEPTSESARIGAAIRQARLAHGLTQTQLAGLAGTGLRFISELERGKPNVALDKTLAAMAVLGLRLVVTGAGS